MPLSTQKPIHVPIIGAPVMSPAAARFSIRSFHLARHARVVLAGFYQRPVSFDLPAAIMREIGIQIAAEWRPDDLTEVTALLDSGRLSLDGLITHCESPQHAADAYRTAFEDADCLKMILDWRSSE